MIDRRSGHQATDAINRLNFVIKHSKFLDRLDLQSPFPIKTLT